MEIPSLDALLGNFKDNRDDPGETHFKQMANDLLQVVYLLAHNNPKGTREFLTLIRKYIIVLTLDPKFREKEFIDLKKFSAYELDYPLYINNAYKHLQEQLRTNTIFS